jgi:MFS family permease
VGGTGNGVQWIALITAVQEQTLAQLQGRVMGFLESMAALCLGVGFSLGGAVAALFNARVTFIMAGAVALAATLAFARATARAEAAPREQFGPGAEPTG